MNFWLKDGECYVVFVIFVFGGLGVFIEKLSQENRMFVRDIVCSILFYIKVNIIYNVFDFLII